MEDKPKGKDQKKKGKQSADLEREGTSAEEEDDNTQTIVNNPSDLKQTKGIGA